MTPAPIEFRIYENLHAALQGIKKSNGFHFDVEELAVKLDPDHDVEARTAPDGPRPFVELDISADEEWEYDAANQVVITLRPRVYWTHDSDPEDDASLVQTFLQGCADVEKAIGVDLSLGGLTSGIRIVNRKLWRQDGGSQVMAELELAIKSYRTFGAPNG